MKLNIGSAQNEIAGINLKDASISLFPESASSPLLAKERGTTNFENHSDFLSRKSVSFSGKTFVTSPSPARAFATIALSLIVIGTGIVLIAIFDPEKGLLNIAFESFSAYSTVGLSLGITGSLSSASKIIIILIMFVGRVSMLSIIVALFKKIKHKN